MRSRFLTRWQGIALASIGVIATLWLALTGRLGLYIHPRYYVFTTIMAVLAGVVLVAALIIVPKDEEHAADPEDRLHSEPTRPAGRWVPFAGSLLVVLSVAVALLVLPPATLTTATAEQRDINAGGTPAAGADPVPLDGDSASFTVKDWADLIRQGAGPDYFADKTADVVGFVTADQDDPDNVFYVTRFVVTCCAVDARPVGVGVYDPGWRDRVALDQWVRVSGRFVANPSIASEQTIVLRPAEVEPSTQPAEPYVY